MTQSFEAREQVFSTEVDGRQVPAIVWTPGGTRARAPLLLVGHGGSGHKRSQLVLDVMQPLVTTHGFSVAAIDGPVHGARRTVFDAGTAVRSEFRDLWTRGGSIDPMVADWRATLDVLTGMDTIDASTIGWYGISMGTAYGLPLVAAEPRIRCAVLGMWGTSRAGTERLVADAPAIDIPVLFQRKSEDEFFTPEGQAELYERLGSRDKRLQDYPGGHTDPAGAQLDDIVAFFVRHLQGN